MPSHPDRTRRHYDLTERATPSAEAIAEAIAERMTKDGYCPDYGTDPWVKAIVEAIHEERRQMTAWWVDAIAERDRNSQAVIDSLPS